MTVDAEDFQAAVADLGAELDRVATGFDRQKRIQLLYAVMREQYCPRTTFMGVGDVVTSYRCTRKWHGENPDYRDHEWEVVETGLRHEDVFIQDPAEKMAALARIVGIS